MPTNWDYSFDSLQNLISINGILVPVRTSLTGLRRRGSKMYQCKVDVDMLNAVKSVLYYFFILVVEKSF